MTAEELFCDLSDKCGESGTDIYYIFHLTYSKQNSEGFPKYEKFVSIYAVKEFMEQAFIKNDIK